MSIVTLIPKKENSGGVQGSIAFMAGVAIENPVRIPDSSKKRTEEKKIECRKIKNEKVHHKKIETRKIEWKKENLEKKCEKKNLQSTAQSVFRRINRAGGVI